MTLQRRFRHRVTPALITAGRSDAAPGNWGLQGHPLDPVTLPTAALLMLGSAALAADVPARAAARMNPLTALRDE